MLPEPVRIGPFLVDGHGHLQLRDDLDEARFTFTWRGARCSVRLSDGVLSLRAQAGRVPSTAEGLPRRNAALEFLRALPGALPAGIRLLLSAEHRLVFEAQDQVGWPSSAVGLLTPVVRMALRLGPVLDVVEAEGLGVGSRS